MNKTKRLLSLFTSVAMAASTFSAIVVPANAEDNLQNFSPTIDICGDTVPAELDFKASEDTDVTADAVYVDNDKIKAVGTYASTLVGAELTIADQSFTNYIQVRIDSDPSTGTITEKAGSTPLVLTVKQAGTLNLYYRRQTVNNECVSADGKDVKISLINEEGTAYTAVQPGTLTVDSYTESVDYAYCTQSYELDEGEYLVWAKGTTIQLYGFSYTVEGEEATTAPTGEPAPEETTAPTEEATEDPTDDPTDEPTEDPTDDPIDELLPREESYTFDEDVAALTETGVHTWDTGSLAGWFCNFGNAENVFKVENGAIVSNVTASSNSTYFGKHLTTVAGAAGKKITVTFDYSSNSGTNTVNNGSEIGFLSYDGDDVSWTQAYNDKLGAYYTLNTYGLTDTSKTYTVTFVIDNAAHKITYTAAEKDAISAAEDADPAEVELPSDNLDINTIYFRTGRQKTDSVDNVEITIDLAGETDATEAPTDEPADETEAPTDEPTEEPADETEAPTEDATEIPTDVPTSVPAADGVYINESFDSYDVAEIIRSTGNDVDDAPAPVTLGSIIYMAGHRGNGPLNDIASIKQNGTNKYFNVSADGYATASRGIYFQFAEVAGIPDVSSIPAGKVLVLDMDIESDQSFTLTGFGTIPAVTGAAAAALSVAEDEAKAVLVPTESADTAVIIKAVYEGGRLVSVVPETVSNVVAGTPIEVNAEAGTKVMLWNSLENMKPLALTAVSAVVTPATDTPTEAVTDAPTEEVTDAPTEAVTDAPTEEVTDAPTEAVTDAPTDAPTEDPDTTETPAPESSLPHLQAVIDPANNKQYVIITAADGTLVSSTVADLTATGFTGAEFFAGAGNFDIDNIKVSLKDADTGILTVKVTDGETGLADAVVTAGGLSGVTGADGTAVFALPNGEYTVTASKSGYEHTQGLQDNASTTATVNSDSQTVELTLSVMSYIKIPDTVTIAGGQEFIAAPKTAEPNKTAAFTVQVLDQYGIEMTTKEYGATWSIFPAGSSEADPSVTIDQEGVVSVAQSFNTGSNIAAYDVTVVAATEDRNQKVTKTLYIGNNDISYYEPIAWVQSGGTSNRNGSVNFAEKVSIPDLVSVTLNVAFPNGTEGQSTLQLTADGGRLVGIQLTSDDVIKAWTGWSGNSALNQSGDIGAFANGEVLVENYDKSAIDVTFVIDNVNKAITVSSGTSTVSLPYTIDVTALTGLSYGQYRNYGAVTVNEVTVREPDNNYLAISGVNGVAKISGTTVTRTYALGQSVIVSDETFTWTVSGDNTAVTIADGVLSIADTAVAGTYTITATSTINAEKTATFDVEIGDFQTIAAEKAEISGPHAYNLGTDTTGTYAITNAIDSYGDDVAALLPAAVWTSDNTDVAAITEDGDLTVVGAGKATITATITNGTAVSTLTVPVTVAAYYITADAAGNTTVVDTSALITDSHITGYQVTTSKDGAIVSKRVVDSAPTSVDTTGADKVEVAPVFEYAVGAPGTLGNVGAGYDIEIPADTYNFVVTDTGNRCDVYVNNQMLVNNILQGGSAVNKLDVNDIVVNEGVAAITTADYAQGQDESGVNISIKVVKSPSIVDRTKKVYVLGDSLVCIYYNGGSDTNNTYQTGWGQVLQNYVSGAEVVDLGNSGVTANGLYGTAFTQVLTSAKPGDILVLESGYNDRTYDTEDIMRTALRNMYNEAKAIGVDVVFVSPNASKHDYNGSVVWTRVMEEIATELEVPYIDLAQQSYDFLYGLYGDNTDAVLANFNVSDALHSQYRGAQKWASIVAGGLIDLGFGDLINTDYTYTFTDTLGNSITCQAAASN